MELTGEYLDKQFANQFKLTKEYFDRQLGNLEKRLGDKFVTKEYLDGKLSQFATKNDLKNFATKQDLETLATKEDLEIFESKIIAAIADMVATPLTRHIEQVKKVLILPEDKEEKAQPVMVKDKPRPKVVYPNAFIEHWIEREKEQWAKDKMPMVRRMELLKLLLPRQDKAFLHRVLNSGR